MHKKQALLLLLSLLCCLAGEAKEPFSRGFEGRNKRFIPQGSFGLGISAGYRQYRVGEMGGFTVLQDHLNGIKGAYSRATVSPSVEYFIKDNWSLLGRFDYGMLGIDLDQASLSLSQDLGIDIRDQHLQRQTYELRLGMRYYVPFMGSRVFGWFVEGTLCGGYVQSKLYGISEEGLKLGTYNDHWKMSLRMDPGVCFFVHENFNFEVSVGLIDLSWEQVQQNENQVINTSNSGFGGNMSINLLAIRLGAHCYF